jgi:hypothetical protein
MVKFIQKVELTANILIIVVALLLVGFIGQRYFYGKSEINQPARVTPTIGKPINLPNQDWSAQSKTVVLALQTTCHFCTESAPFYKRLVEYAKNNNIKIIAVFPQPVEVSTAHLAQLGLTGLEIKQAPISVLDTSGTPTLIITNQQGKVTNFWVGKLPPEKETEVINTLNS